jgi:hypothetical protein
MELRTRRHFHYRLGMQILPSRSRSQFHHMLGIYSFMTLILSRALIESGGIQQIPPQTINEALIRTLTKNYGNLMRLAIVHQSDRDFCPIAY